MNSSDGETKKHGPSELWPEILTGSTGPWSPGQEGTFSCSVWPAGSGSASFWAGGHCLIHQLGQ